MSLLLEPNVEQIKEQKLYRDMGLTDEEFANVEQLLGRTPNYTETGLFSVMWSEHCSYKNSKPVLKNSLSRVKKYYKVLVKELVSLILVITKPLYLKSKVITIHQRLNLIKEQQLV